MLLLLPEEIIYSICSLFCAHCCDLDDLPLGRHFIDDNNILQHRHKQGTLTLQNLVQTCSKLRSTVQPILYHAPTFYSYTRLARTLLSRPDLASAVRVYTYLFRIRKYGPKYPSYAVYEDMDFMLETARSQRVVEKNISINNLLFIPPDTRETSQPILPTETLLRRPRYADYIHIQIEWFDRLAEETILALLPNLEVVVVRIINRPETTALQGYPFAHIFPNPSQNWPLLHTLAIEQITTTGNMIAGISMLHHYQPLLKKAPNLQRLVLSSPDRETKSIPELSSTLPPLDGIRQLILHGMIVPSPNYRAAIPQTSYIAELTVLCCNLDSFSVRPRHHATWAWASISEFSPTCHLRDLPTKTLRHLALHSSQVRIRQDIMQEGLHLLKDFVALESLIIDEQCICKHWLKDKDQLYSYEGSYIPNSTPVCLTSILPPYLKNLTVRLHDKYYAVGDIVELGKEVAGGGFLDLARVSVVFLDEVKQKERYNYPYDVVLEGEKRRDFLEAVAEKQGALQNMTQKWQQEILAAFEGTRVDATVERVIEDVFSMQPQPAVADSFHVHPDNMD